MEAVKGFSYKGLARFIIIAACLYLFFGIISPRLVALSPALTHYGDVQNTYGLHSASLYYTDQATIQDTQSLVRRGLLVSGHIEPQENE